MRTTIIICIVFSIQFLSAQEFSGGEASGEVRIDDEDQVSGKFGTLMDGIETVEKLKNIAKAASTSSKIISEGSTIIKEGVGSLKDRFSFKNLKGMLLVMRKGLLIKLN